MSPEKIHLLSRALTSLFVPVLLAWLLYAARREARLHTWQDKFLLTYGREMKAFSVVLLLFAAVLVWLAASAKPEDQMVAALVTAGLLAIIAVFVLETFRVRVEFAGEHICCFTPWRSHRVIPWSAVEKIEYSSMLQWWVVTTRGHGKIRLHSYLNGLGDFLGTAKVAGINILGPIPPVRRPS